MSNFIKFFKELGIKDVPMVGGKNASLGEMFQKLTSQGINVPNGNPLIYELDDELKPQQHFYLEAK